MHRTTTRRLRGAALLLAGALALSACGGQESADRSAASGPKGSAPTQQPVERPLVPAPITAELQPANVAAGLTDVDAQSAYEYAVAFASQWTYRPELLRTDHTRTPAAYASATTSMTPSMAQSWTATVDNAFAGVGGGATNLAGVAYYNVGENLGALPEGAGWELAGSGPLVVDYTITEPAVTLEGDGRVAVTFTESGEFVGQRSGEPVRARGEKTVTFRLERQQGGSWRIDAHETAPSSWAQWTFLAGEPAGG